MSGLPDISFAAIPGASVILPGLYMGDQTSGVAAANRGFDMVVNLTPNTMGTQPAMKAGATYHAFAISDGPEPIQRAGEINMLHDYAEEAAEVIRRGGSVLIHCAAGLNRSGLLTALIVRQVSRITGHDAAATVRAKREGSLFNQWFSLYLDGLPLP